MLHMELLEWSKTYGPVMSVYLGSTLVIVVNDIKTAMEVLVQRGSDYAGRVSLPSLDVISFKGKNIAFGQYGPIWRLHRQIATIGDRELIMSTNPRSQNLQVAPRLLSGNGGI